VTTAGTAKASTLFRGVWFERKNGPLHPSTQKAVYTVGAMSDWQTHKVVDKVVLVHHNCFKCVVTKTCGAHAKECPLPCPAMRIQIRHSSTQEYLIEENYKNLSS